MRANVFIAAALVAGLALLSGAAWFVERENRELAAIFHVGPAPDFTYTTSMAPLDLTTGFDRAHAVRWRIPAAYVNWAPDYSDSPLYANRPPDAKQFIILSFDLDSLEPWALKRPTASKPGKQLHRVEVRIDASTPGYPERARDGEKSKGKYWTASGETISDLTEERPAPNVQLPSWRFLPPSDDSTHVIAIECIRFPREDHLRGCSARSFLSDEIPLQYLFWSTDLSRWREIDTKTRQFLAAFIVAP